MVKASQLCQPFFYGKFHQVGYAREAQFEKNFTFVCFHRARTYVEFFRHLFYLQSVAQQTDNFFFAIG